MLSALTVVCKGVWELNRFFVQVSVFIIALPTAMRGFMVAHQKEWFICVPCFHPINTLVSYDISGISRNTFGARGIDKFRVPVFALTGHDAPVVEPGRFMGFALAEMPLADHGGLVPSRLEMLSHVGQMLIDFGVKSHDAVDVVMCTAKNRCSGWSADAVGHVTVVEEHAFVGYAIEIWRMIDASSIARNRLRCMVICHDEDDVGPFLSHYEMMMMMMLGFPGDLWRRGRSQNEQVDQNEKEEKDRIEQHMLFKSRVCVI